MNAPIYSAGGTLDCCATKFRKAARDEDLVGVFRSYHKRHIVRAKVPASMLLMSAVPGLDHPAQPPSVAMQLEAMLLLTTFLQASVPCLAAQNRLNGMMEMRRARPAAMAMQRRGPTWRVQQLQPRTRQSESRGTQDAQGCSRGGTRFQRPHGMGLLACRGRFDVRPRLLQAYNGSMAG